MNKLSLLSWVHIASALLLGICFFLPWVNWDGSMLNGLAIANGEFFKVSESRFGLANPFPGISFIFFVFWLIPLVSIAIICLTFLKRKATPLSFLTGALALGLATIFILFTRVLVDLGAGSTVSGMLKPGLYIYIVAAVTLVLSAFPVKTIAWKFAWLLLGPVIAFTSFKLTEKYVLGETHKNTTTVDADFKVNATGLINEFLTNDTAANRKYIEKMIEVNGNVTAIEILPDSSSTFKFADSSGSYLVFSFEKDEFPAISPIQPGTAISVKGVCSGSIFSDILGITSISFKRATLTNK